MGGNGLLRAQNPFLNGIKQDSPSSFLLITFINNLMGFLYSFLNFYLYSYFYCKKSPGSVDGKK